MLQPNQISAKYIFSEYVSSPAFLLIIVSFVQVFFKNLEARLLAIFVILLIIIANPIFSGSNIYSNQAPKQIKTDIDSGDYKINIKQVKVLSLEKDQKVLLHFLNNALRNLLTRMDYS